MTLHTDIPTRSEIERLLGGALSARDLWLMMMDTDDAASQDEIEQVLEFLASPLISAVVARTNSAFVAALPPTSVSAKLAALRMALSSSDGVSRSRQVEPLRRDSKRHSTADADSNELESAKVAPAAVRRWAITQGMQVSLRGRLPSHLVQKYVRESGEV